MMNHHQKLWIRVTTKRKVDNGSENTETGELVGESHRNEGVNVARDGDEKVLGDAVLV